MAWLLGQVWSLYLLAFAAGLLLARLLLVAPAQRRLRAASARPAPADAVTEALPVIPAAPAPGGDGAGTQRLPAVDPALSTLDHAAGSAGIGAGIGVALGAPPRREPDTDPDTAPIPVTAPGPAAVPGRPGEGGG